MSSSSPDLKSAQIENPKQNNTPVILSSCTSSSSDPIDSHDFALPAKKTPPDSVESISILKNTNTCTKTGNTQVLLLQKPASSSPMVIQNKNILPVVSGIDSSSNVTVVQPVIGPSGTTKFVTIPAMGLLPGVSAANPNLPTSLTTVKGNDVKILVPQAGISSNTISNIKQSTGNNSSTQKCSVGHGSGNQVITKVIITSNPSANQTPGASIPVQSGSGCVSSSVGAAAQPVLIASPTKTLTLSRNLTNVSGTQQIIRTIPGTPPKQGMYVLSPVKTASKLAVPVAMSKSPRRIAPATKTLLSSVVSGSKMCVVASATTAATVSRTGIPIQSPTKVILKPVQQTVLKPTVSNANASLSTSSFTSVMGASSVTAVQQSTSTISGASTQQIQVPGSKFHYVRLVSAPSSSTTTSSVTKSTTLIPVTNDRTLTPTLVPVTSTSSTTVTTSMSSGQVRLTVPIAPALTTQSQMISKQGGQRFIIPSPSLAQIRPNSALPTTQLSQLPTGTLIPMGGTAQGFVMVPAHYVTQLQQPSQSAVQGPRMVIQPVQHQNILPAPASSPNTPSGGSNSSFISLSSIPNNQNLQAPNVQTTLPTTQPQSRHLNGRTPVETTDNRPRKPCNCTKSQCLKLYCDCFANGEFCNNCNCYNCYNNLSHEEERQKAIKACLDRNPLAFHPKIGKSREGDQERRHTKGCNCKRSGCLKNYCECYEAKILCTNLCKCIGCKNFEDSSERKTLMHLADAAEVRVQQQAAAKTKLSSQILDLPTKPPIISTTGERLPFSFVTQEVVEATCLCLLAQAEDGEKSGQHPSVIEKLVFEEFGRCLRQIIDCANRTKVPNTDS